MNLNTLFILYRFHLAKGSILTNIIIFVLIFNLLEIIYYENRN
jgi:hypothetical protein